MLRSVIRLVVAMPVWAALSAVAAHAQSAPSAPTAPSASNLPSGDDHYQFNQIDDGYLRLDLKTGEVSQCKARPAGWSCLAVPDERAAFDGEIARLQDENAALKKALLDHGLPLPGGVAPLAATWRLLRPRRRLLRAVSRPPIPISSCRAMRTSIA